MFLGEAKDVSTPQRPGRFLVSVPNGRSRGCAEKRTACSDARDSSIRTGAAARAPNGNASTLALPGANYAVRFAGATVYAAAIAMRDRRFTCTTSKRGQPIPLSDSILATSSFSAETAITPNTGRRYIISREPFIDDSDFTLYVGDAVEVLRDLPDESVHMVCTSPPYW